MPIKFRCQKCRQFLGISRSLAGQVVDCPTCGRATRVPNLDGSRKPIPAKPELDKADSSLLNALDQLAELGTAPAKPKNGSVSDSAAAVAEPAEPIPAEPLKPIAVVDPPTVAVDSEDSDRHPVVIDDPTEPLDSAAVLQSLAENAAPLATVPEPKNSNRLLTVLVGLVTGLVCASGGFLVGQRMTSKPEPADSPEVAPVVGEKPSDIVPGLTGRITFRRVGAECLPDKGARVIAWPVGTAPETPWPPDGFRSGDSEDLVAAASDKLAELGGAMTVVGDDGMFELPLESGGDFNVFIVSRFGSRSVDAEPTNGSEMARLKMSFAEPQRLIGKTQFELTQVTFRGETQQILDHVFEVAE